MSKIIDISKWQGNMNFKVTKQKVDGVMMRCAYGTTQDTKFNEYSNLAKAEGIPFGAYVFSIWHYDSVNNKNASTARTKALAEVEKVISILKDKGITGFVAIDLELENKQTTSLSKAEMTEIANVYMDKLAQAGYKPCLYCSISWVFDRMTPKDIKYPLWIAYYHEAGFFGNSFPETKYGNLMRGIKDKIIMWQYSSKGDGKSFGASSEYIDLNHIYTEFTQKEETQAPVATPLEQQKNEPNKYIVQKGDTLTGIAKKHNILLSFLILANPQITNPNLIRVGQVINIPSSENTVTHKPTPPIIKVGSKVKVKQGAKTFDGKGIAKFVYNGTYTVDELKGNRAVLDKKGICTPVNINDLVVVF